MEKTLILNYLKNVIANNVSKIDTFQGKMNVCIEISSLMRNEPLDSFEIFKVFLENADFIWNEEERIRENSSIDLLSEIHENINFADKKENNDLRDSLSAFAFRYKNYICGIIDLIFAEHLTPEEYYQRLWNMLQENNLFASKERNEMMLFLVWGDSRTPYYHFESPLGMENCEFLEVTDKIKPEISKLLFVLNANYLQRTEEASCILEILNSIHDSTSKVVFIANLILCLKAQNKNGQNQ